MKLKAASLRTLPAGRHGDNAYGLYFNVKPSGARSWVQRLVIDGRRRTFGLGPWPVVTLVDARDAAIDNVRKRRAGLNPIVARKRASKMPTFAQATDSYIKLQASGWKAGSRNESNWRSSLVHAKAIADSPVDGIMTDDVFEIVAKLLRAGKAPTAKAVRQRIRLVFDWCIAQGHRSDNPANGAIDAILPKANHKVEHRASVAHGDMGEVLRKVRAIADPKWRGLTGAFELAVLTAARTSEVLGMRWSEVDFDTATWTVPAARMKAGKPHRVPLSAPALALLRAAHKRSQSGLVFRSPTGKRIDEAGLRRVAKRIELAGTVHGMRGAFKSWAMDTGIDRAVAEFALAHSFMGDVEASYVRTDLLEKRRPVMEAWGRHCDATTI